MIESNDLRTSLEAIRDEYLTSANTAERVGRALIGLLDYIESAVSAVEVNNGYYACNIGGHEPGKAITATGFALPLVGGGIKVKMTHANTYEPTVGNPVKLVVNNDTTNAKEIYYNGNPVTASNTWESGEVVYLYYDGTRWLAHGDAFRAIAAINTKLQEGYLYAGIAEPTDNPPTPAGRVFYIALAGGTYAHFANSGSVAPHITNGINILKYDGTAWSAEQVIAFDTVPTQDSNGLLLSGAVYTAVAIVKALMGYYVCETAAGSQNKAITASGFALPANGGSMKVRMIYANTYVPTAGNPVRLVVNNDTANARELYYNGAPVTAENTWPAGITVEVHFDGTRWQAVRHETLLGAITEAEFNTIFGIDATESLRGSYNLVSDLHLTLAATRTQIGTALAAKMTVLGITAVSGDYAYVKVPFDVNRPVYVEHIERYSYNGTSWVFEFSYDKHIIDTTYDGVFDISAYHATDGSPVPYADLGAALGTNGANVPESERRGGMTVRFLSGVSGQYEQWRLMKDPFSTTKADWQGVDKRPMAGSRNLAESGGVYESQITLADDISKGFIVDYNHVWNFDSTRSISRYQSNDNYDAVIVPVSEDCLTVGVVSGMTVTTRFVYETVFPEEGVNKYNTVPRTETGVIPYGTRYVIINVKKESNPDFDPKALVISLTRWRDGYKTSLPLLAGKRVSVLGASIDTFGEYSYGYDSSGEIEQNNRYPGTGTNAQGGNGNDVTKLCQTWWMQVINRCGATLERCNAIGSSSISTNDIYGKTSFLEGNHNGLVRCQDLGNPDVILVHGGHNEPSGVACTFDPSIPTEDLDTLDFGQAYDKMCRLMMAQYPNARIISLLQTRSSSDSVVRRFDTIRKICVYYGIEYVNMVGKSEVTTISTDSVHPDANGMSIIADCIISRLEEKYKLENVTLLSEQSPYDDPDVKTYFVDEEYKVFAIQHVDGSIEPLALTQKKYREKETLVMLSSDTDIQGDNILKYLTDENGTCFGYIRDDGTVVIYKLEVVDGNGGQEAADKKQFATVVSLIANGVDNIQLSRNQKFMSTLHNLSESKELYINSENENNKNLRPRISLIDDDTVDNQIPSSRGESTPTTKSGGYFSVLLPFMLSLGAKYGKRLCPGLACEGHRVGLTALRSSDDTYTALNENGLCVKWLHDNMGWNVLNHSMTAQLPMDAYYVDGINSSIADAILATGQYHGELSFHNTIVLDRLTGKWYEVNSTCDAWVERTPTKKYAMPFYRQYINPDTPSANHKGPWFFNRDFDFEYSWGEWIRRADELGLPYEKVIVHNGSTTHPCTINAGRKYAYFSVSTSGTQNYPPIQSALNRVSIGTGDNNVINQSKVSALMNAIDECISGKTWVVFMSHFNDQGYHANYYLDGLVYPGKDDNYSDEWIIPLKHEEIVDIIGENTHDYINHPPSRLGITSWDEWHPAPGTQLAGFYSVLDYALSQGVEFVTPLEGWNTHGNILNLGVDSNGKTYVYDTEEQTPYTDDEKSYLTVGADMSIRYYNSKQ